MGNAYRKKATSNADKSLPELQTEDQEVRQTKLRRIRALIKNELPNTWRRILKMVILFSFLLVCVIVLIYAEEAKPLHMIALEPNSITDISLGTDKPTFSRIKCILIGRFVRQINITRSNSNTLIIEVKMVRADGVQETVGNPLQLTLPSSFGFHDNLPQTQHDHFFELSAGQFVAVTHNPPSSAELLIQLRSKCNHSVPLQLQYRLHVPSEHFGPAIGTAIIFVMYTLIIFDIVHRTVAAMMASTATVAALAYIDERPDWQQIVQLIEVETVLMLFSVMLFVAVMARTGIFDWLAVYVYRWTEGRVWQLILTLCALTFVLVAILDNVSTILLVTPLTIRLCEVAELDPIPVLIILMIACNIMGIATPIGDPPNIMLLSNEYLREKGVTFVIIMAHMLPGIVITLAVLCVQMRFVQFRDAKQLKFREHPEIAELRHEIAIWKNTVQNMSAAYSRDEDTIQLTIQRKIEMLEHRLKRKIYMATPSRDVYQVTLSDLKAKYPILDRSLLYKCLAVLALIIIGFVAYSVSTAMHLSFGWTALCGLLLLLILANHSDIDDILHQVEWSTLLFIVCLCVVIGCLQQLGLTSSLARIVEHILTRQPAHWQVTSTILIFVWVFGILSGFLDNIPLASVMLRIVPLLNESPELNVPLIAMVCAVLFAAGFGGNGTLVGASSNIVCAGVAESHGLDITFWGFFKIGFPVTIMTLAVATLYLLFCHVLFDWNYVK